MVLGVLGVAWDGPSCFLTLDMGHWIALESAFGVISRVGIWCLDVMSYRVGMACGVSHIVYSTFLE